MITYKYDIDMTSGGKPLEIPLKQYDTDFEIVFSLIDRKGIMVLESGTAVKIRGTKPDGYGYSVNATLDIATKTVTVEGAEQLTIVAGKAPFELALLKGTKILNTATFYLRVYPAALSDDSKISDSDMSDFRKAVIAAEIASAAAESATASAETAVEAAESVSGAVEAAEEAAEAAAASEANAALSETNAASYASSAESSAAAASASATNAATSESNAAGSASAASESETNASGSASSAAESALHASGSASAAASSATAAGTAQTAAETARSLAEDSAEDSEAWAVGKRNGTDVPITDETYHNNAKYWAEQAEEAAGGMVTTNRIVDKAVTAAKIDDGAVTYAKLAADVTTKLLGAMHYIGVTTTALTDGSSTNPITIGGQSVTAVAGDVAIYDVKEFIFSDTDDEWHELGSVGSLRALAFKDDASATYTPAGTCSGMGVTLATDTVNSITDVGTLPSLSVTVANEEMTISFSQGTLPTKGSSQTVATGVQSVTQPTFTGTQATITVS